MNTVGPTIRMNSSSTTASPMLKLLSHWTPRPDARHRRDDERASEHRDDHHRECRGRLHVPDEVQPAVDLQSAKPERGRAAEHRREDRQHVDRLADRPVHAVAEQRMERRADQVRHALAEAEVAQREPDRPRTAPTDAAPSGSRCTPSPYGAASSVPGFARPERRRGQVRDRLGDAVEHQPDPHPGAEHHRDPGHRPELGAVVVLAETDPPVAGHGDETGEDQEGRGRQHEQPAETVDDPAKHVPHDRRQLIGPQHPHQHERHGDSEGDKIDLRVDPRSLLVHLFPSLS